MNTHRSAIKNVVICVLILSNIVCAGFLVQYKEKSEQQSLAIQREYLSLQSEVCAVLCGDDYDVFAETAYKYEEISQIYDKDPGFYRAINFFLNEAYFEDSAENRTIIANRISEAEQEEQSERQLLAAEIVNEANDMFYEWDAN
jgi:hypothetical protein